MICCRLCALKPSAGQSVVSASPSWPMRVNLDPGLWLTEDFLMRTVLDPDASRKLHGHIMLGMKIWAKRLDYTILFHTHHLIVVVTTNSPTLAIRFCQNVSLFDGYSLLFTLKKCSELYTMSYDWLTDWLRRLDLQVAKDCFDGVTLWASSFLVWKHLIGRIIQPYFLSVNLKINDSSNNKSNKSLVIVFFVSLFWFGGRGNEISLKITLISLMTSPWL